MNQKGENLMKRKSISLLLMSVILIFVCYILIGKNKNDFLGLAVPAQKIKLEYKSERGFGNDRFDIYSFSIEDEVEFNQEESNLEEIYEKEFRSILNIESKKNQKLRELQKRIEELKDEKRFVYQYFTLEGTKKLYLYDQVSNKGYCFILTI